MEKWWDGAMRFCINGRKPDVALVAFIQRHRCRLGARAATSDAGDVCVHRHLTPPKFPATPFGWMWFRATKRPGCPMPMWARSPQGPMNATRVSQPQSTIARVSPRTAATQHPESQHQGAAVTQCQAPLACTDDSPCPAPHARPPQQCTAMPMDPARMALDNEIVPQK